MLASSFSRPSLSSLHVARPRHLAARRRAAFLSVFGAPTRSIKRGIWQAARVDNLGSIGVSSRSDLRKTAALFIPEHLQNAMSV